MNYDELATEKKTPKHFQVCKEIKFVKKNITKKQKTYKIWAFLIKIRKTTETSQVLNVCTKTNKTK